MRYICSKRYAYKINHFRMDFLVEPSTNQQVEEDQSD